LVAHWQKIAQGERIWAKLHANILPKPASPLADVRQRYRSMLKQAAEERGNVNPNRIWACLPKIPERLLGAVAEQSRRHPLMMMMMSVLSNLSRPSQAFHSSDTVAQRSDWLTR
jgi:hypothetical protein